MLYLFALGVTLLLYMIDELKIFDIPREWNFLMITTIFFMCFFDYKMNKIIAEIHGISDAITNGLTAIKESIEATKKNDNKEAKHLNNLPKSSIVQAPAWIPKTKEVDEIDKPPISKKTKS